MSVLQGYWFDGKTSARISAEMRVDAEGNVHVIHLADGSTLYEGAFHFIRISSRLGNTPRYLYFNGDEKFETLDNQSVDQLLNTHRRSFFNTLAHQLESHIYFVGLTLVVVMALSWAGIKYGLPAASTAIANRLPANIMNMASTETLTLLDKIHLKPTGLPQDVQMRLLNHFEPAIKDNSDLGLQVLFRDGGDLGANAFALPNGTIVFTDQMVMLAKTDDELLAVLGHEIGHVKYRHAVRSAIQGSSMGFFVTMLTGDLSAVSGVLAALPVILTAMSYSRDFEREADQYALDYLNAHDIDAMNFVTLMERVTYEAHCDMLLAIDKKVKAPVKKSSADEASKDPKQPESKTQNVLLTAAQRTARKQQCDRLIEQHKSDKSAVMDYFSTHPATEERLQKFRSAH